eukprot:3256667-Lingulodinium_polyedra.AAC.1
MCVVSKLLRRTFAVRANVARNRGFRSAANASRICYEARSQHANAFRRNYGFERACAPVCAGEFRNCCRTPRAAVREFVRTRFATTVLKRVRT